MTLKTITGMQVKYLLRWRFEFSGGKPTKVGGWSRSGETKELQAWSVNKEGLIAACIEGKNIHTRETKMLAACDGHEFVNFEWVAGAVSSPFIKSAMKLKSQILGLAMVTRKYRAVIQVDGGVRVTELKEEAGKFNLASFGK
jgi:hypothetical protein